MFKTLIPQNTSILKSLFFVGDGGKVVYNSWKEVIINLIISIITTILLYGLFIICLLFNEGIIKF